MTVAATVGSAQAQQEPGQAQSGSGRVRPKSGQGRPDSGRTRPESGQARPEPGRTPPESLAEALDRVYRALAEHTGKPAEDERVLDRAALRSPTIGGDAWHPFTHLSNLFDLTPFERDLIVLCTGVELEHRFISSCASAATEDGARRPTLALALTVLEEPHWSAITPGAPLRYWRLIELGGGNLLDAPLQLDERVLEFVLGVPALDARLQSLVRPISLAAGGDPPGTSQRGPGRPGTAPRRPGGPQTAQRGPGRRTTRSRSACATGIGPRRRASPCCWWAATAPAARPPSCRYAASWLCRLTRSTPPTCRARLSSASTSPACGRGRRFSPGPPYTCEPSAARRWPTRGRGWRPRGRRSRSRSRPAAPRSGSRASACTSARSLRCSGASCGAGISARWQREWAASWTGSWSTSTSTSPPSGWRRRRYGRRRPPAMKPMRDSCAGASAASTAGARWSPSPSGSTSRPPGGHRAPRARRWRRCVRSSSTCKGARWSTIVGASPASMLAALD